DRIVVIYSIVINYIPSHNIVEWVVPCRQIEDRIVARRFITVVAGRCARNSAGIAISPIGFYALHNHITDAGPLIAGSPGVMIDGIVNGIVPFLSAQRDPA